MRVSVVTPSLNKSFKFQSDWPYNNSQVYLLNSIIDDLKADEDREFKVKGDGYLLTSTVNYPNNKSLVKQNVYVSKDGQINKVEVVDKSDSAQIVMKFNKQEFNRKFDKNYFLLSSLLEMNSKSDSSKKNNTSESSEKENNSTTNNSTETDNTNQKKETSENTNNNTSSNENTNTNTNTDESSNKNGAPTEEKTTTNTKEETTAKISDVVYPMYLPSNTYLTSQDTVKTKDGNRLILTFGGDSSFVLVEETAGKSDISEVIPVSGDFDFLSDVIGVIGNKSLSWHSNGIDYYMTSDTLEVSELVNIARSVSVLPVSK